VLAWLSFGTSRAEARTLTRHLNRTRRAQARPHSPEALHRRIAAAYAAEDTATARRLEAMARALDARNRAPERLYAAAASLLDIHLRYRARHELDGLDHFGPLAEQTGNDCRRTLRAAAALAAKDGVAVVRVALTLGRQLRDTLTNARHLCQALTTLGRATGRQPDPPLLYTGPCALVRALVAPGAPPLAGQPAAA